MAAVDRLEFRITLLPLFRGRIELPYIDVDRPRLLLERNRDGEGNWTFAQQPVKPQRAGPVIGQLFVNDGSLRVHEPTFRTDLRLDIRTARAKNNARAALLANGAGTYRGYPFQLDGRVDSPLDLHGQLHHDGDVWSYRKFTGKLGDSDMRGDVSIDVARERERPLLRGELVSQRLDFDDLASLIGAAPSAKPGETISPEQRALALQLQARPKVLPDRPFRLDKLRVMDADVKLRAEQIEAPKLPLEKMSVHAVLENGVLRLSPLIFDAAGGNIATRVSLDARKPSIQTTAVADLRDLELSRLFPSVEITKRGTGRLSGAMTLPRPPRCTASRHRRHCWR